MKLYFSLPVLMYIFIPGIFLPALSYSQNIGIGTPNPQKLLSVNGSILLDQGNTNIGTLDSAALLFGTLGGVGISSQKSAGEMIWGLSLWTDNQPRINIRHNGNVGIGTSDPVYNLHIIGSAYASSFFRAPYGYFSSRVGINGFGNESYRLHVNEGDSYFGGKGTFEGAIGVGAANLTGHKLYVSGTSQFTSTVNIGGILNGTSAGFTNNIVVGTTASIGTNLTVGNDGIIEGNFRVNGRVGINGPTQSEYKLIVNGGNSYFQGNIVSSGNGTVMGTMNAAGDLIIKGKGHVRSNGSSNLRIGFDSRAMNVTIAGGGVVDVIANITDFAGGASDIRVSIAQFDPDPAPQYVYWTYFDMKIYDVDPETDQCRIRIWNRAASQYTLKGTLYLTSIVRGD